MHNAEPAVADLFKEDIVAVDLALEVDSLEVIVRRRHG